MSVPQNQSWRTTSLGKLGEDHDLASQMPDKAKALRDQLAAWRESVGAKMPTPNPDYRAGASQAKKKLTQIGGVSHIKVLSDKVEDVSSIEAWKNSFIKPGMKVGDPENLPRRTGERSLIQRAIGPR